MNLEIPGNSIFSGVRGRDVYYLLSNVISQERSRVHRQPTRIGSWEAVLSAPSPACRHKWEYHDKNRRGCTLCKRREVFSVSMDRWFAAFSDHAFATDGFFELPKIPEKQQPKRQSAPPVQSVKKHVRQVKHVRRVSTPRPVRAPVQEPVKVEIVSPALAFYLDAVSVHRDICRFA